MTATAVRTTRRALPVRALSAHPTVLEALRRALAVHVNRLVKSQRELGDADDAEAVHQARVAVRRLRSDLRTFRPLLDRAWVDDLRERLAAIADALGKVRDGDVMHDRLRSAAARLADPSAAEPLLERLHAARELHRSELLADLRVDTHTQVMDDVTAAARAPRLTVDREADARGVLTPLARKSWVGLRRKVKALPKTPTSMELHAVRIAAKRARYAAEALAPVVGEEAEKFAKRLADVQTCLGDAHDASVAAVWLSEQPREDEGEAAAIDELLRMQRGEAAALESGWKTYWRDARDKRLRAWMRAA